MFCKRRTPAHADDGAVDDERGEALLPRGSAEETGAASPPHRHRHPRERRVPDGGGGGDDTNGGIGRGESMKTDALRRIGDEMYGEILRSLLSESGVVEAVDPAMGNTLSSVIKGARARKRFLLMTQHANTAREVIYFVLEERPHTTPEDMCKAIDRIFAGL